MDKAHELADLIIKLAGLREERKQQNEMYRNEIKILEEQIQKLSIKIRSNQMEIPVEMEE